MEEKIIEIKAVNKGYQLGDDTVPVLKDIDFTVKKGEFEALAGLPISSTAKVMYCKMLDTMLTKNWNMRTEFCLYIFLSGSLPPNP